MSQDNHIKIAAMREGGQHLGRILNELLAMVSPGVSLMDIELEAQRLIKKAGGTPSFQTVEDYQYATCLCVNDDVVHGIPTEYLLEEGDILTIDVGILFKGFHTDTAWTKIVKGPKTLPDKEKEKFLAVGEKALWESMKQAKAGNRVGHISKVTQEIIEGAGYSIVKSLVGHGVGRELHEKPQIPGYVRGHIESTPLLTAGMTIAVEIIYAQGKGDIAYANDDGWTLATKDGSLSSVFEHSILIGDGEPEVLTLSVK